MKKTSKQLDFTQEVDYWTGQLTLSVGRGDLRGTVGAMVMYFLQKCRSKP